VDCRFGGCNGDPERKEKMMDVERKRDWKVPHKS